MFEKKKKRKHWILSSLSVSLLLSPSSPFWRPYFSQGVTVEKSSKLSRSGTAEEAIVGEVVGGPPPKR